MISKERATCKWPCYGASRGPVQSWEISQPEKLHMHRTALNMRVSEAFSITLFQGSNSGVFFILKKSTCSMHDDGRAETARSSASLEVARFVLTRCILQQAMLCSWCISKWQHFKNRMKPKSAMEQRYQRLMEEKQIYRT